MEPSDISAAPFVQATVHAEAFEVEYVRGGRGAPVLLLFGTEGSGRLRAGLGRALVGRFRVLAPEAARFPGESGEAARMPSHRPALPLWLRGFLEGLGLTRVSVVADECFGPAALGFALLEPERVDRLVLLREAEPLAQPGGAAHAESFERPGEPLLVLHLLCGAEVEPDERVAAWLADEVIGFLDPERAVPIQPS